MRSPVLGIDLGTTNSVVAVADSADVRVLADEDGHHLTPSVVSFHPTGDVLVGHSARERRLVDASNTISSVKRLIGRPYRSTAVRRAADRFAFKLSEGETGGVLVHARGQSYSLPEISAFVLRRVKALAQNALGAEVSQAVVTVPANFNELQRTATRDAGRIAGLEVLRIINEPTAAALAYGYGAKTRERVAVYDLGGGTFDVSVLDLSGDVIEVLATAGDTYLGGDDIDGLLADRMVQRFLEQHRVDLATDGQATERLRMAAEWLKCQLSERDQAQVTIEEIAYGPRGKPLDLEYSMSIEDMEQLTFPLLGRTFDICEEALKTAGLRPSQLDSVILVGGQTRMPQVRKMVGEYFGREPLVSVDPDEVVAQGAALQAYALSGLERPAWKSPLSQPPPSAQLSSPSQRPSFFPEPTSDSPSGAAPKLSSPPRHVTLPPPARLPDDLPPRVAGVSLPDPKRSTLRGVGQSQPPQVDNPFDEITTLHQGPTAGTGFDEEPTSIHRRGDDGSAPVQPVAKVALRSTQDRAAPTPASEVGQMVIEGPGAPEGRPRPPAPEPRSAKPVARPAPRGEASKVPPPPPPAGGSPPPPPPPEALRPKTPPPADDEAELPQALRTVPPRPERPAEREPASEPLPDAGLDAQPLGVQEVQDVQRTDDAEASFDEEPTSVEALPVATPAQRVPAAAAVPQVLDLRGPAADEPSPPSSEAPAARGPGPLLLDVTPLTLAIETTGGYCEQVIERNAPIPTEQERVFSTSQDRQTVVRMRVCQGESRRIDDNQVLGHLELLGLPEAPRGKVRINVTFMLDANGTLQARAHDSGTGKEHRIRVSLVGALGDNEIDRLRERQAAMYGGS